MAKAMRVSTAERKERREAMRETPMCVEKEKRRAMKVTPVAGEEGQLKVKAKEGGRTREDVPMGCRTRPRVQDGPTVTLTSCSLGSLKPTE